MNIRSRQGPTGGSRGRTTAALRLLLRAPEPGRWASAATGALGTSATNHMLWYSCDVADADVAAMTDLVRGPATLLLRDDLYCLG